MWTRSPFVPASEMSAKIVSILNRWQLYCYVIGERIFECPVFCSFRNIRQSIDCASQSLALLSLFTLSKCSNGVATLRGSLVEIYNPKTYHILATGSGVQVASDNSKTRRLFDCPQLALRVVAHIFRSCEFVRTLPFFYRTVMHSYSSNALNMGMIAPSIQVIYHQIVGTQSWEYVFSIQIADGYSDWNSLFEYFYQRRNGPLLINFILSSRLEEWQPSRLVVVGGPVINGM